MTHLSRSSSRSSRSYVAHRRTAQFLVYSVVIAASLLALYPMGLMALNSFKSDNEMVINPGGWPINWTLKSYGNIFKYHGGMWVNFLVSVGVSLSSTLIAVLFCAMAGFAFSKYRFKGSGAIFAMLLATMMVPREITIPGRYLLFAKLMWLDKLQALILPTITPVIGLFLIRQYMDAIPDALLEAARIDGAGHFQVFWRIMVPTSAPVLGAFSILQFMGVWNQYLWPAIAVRSRNLQPLMVVLPMIVDPEIGFIPAWGTIMAGCTLSVIPILIVFVAFQDTFLSSVVIGAVKV